MIGHQRRSSSYAYNNASTLFVLVCHPPPVSAAMGRRSSRSSSCYWEWVLVMSWLIGLASSSLMEGSWEEQEPLPWKRSTLSKQGSNSLIFNLTAIEVRKKALKTSRGLTEKCPCGAVQPRATKAQDSVCITELCMWSTPIMTPVPATATSRKVLQ